MKIRRVENFPIFDYKENADIYIVVKMNKNLWNVLGNEMQKKKKKMQNIQSINTHYGI